MKQIIYVFLLTVLSSCDSYLSKVPSPSTSAPINNVEQLVAIYDNATAFINETNPFACYSNDDADLTAELYKADPSAFAISSTVFYKRILGYIAYSRDCFTGFGWFMEWRVFKYF